jgi:hypothetical protein
VSQQRRPRILVGSKQANHAQGETYGGLFALIEGIGVDSRRSQYYQIGLQFAAASLNYLFPGGRYATEQLCFHRTMHSRRFLQKDGRLLGLDQFAQAPEVRLQTW